MQYICVVFRVWCLLCSSKCTGAGTGTGVGAGADAVFSVHEYVKVQYAEFCQDLEFQTGEDK